MKRLLFLSALLASLTWCAACNDDDLPLELNASSLEQTAWDAHRIAYDGQGAIVGESSYILEFRTDTTGKYTELDANGDYLRTLDFSYTIDRKLIAFQSALTQTWTIIKRTKNEIVMQTFLESKLVMTLTRK